MSPEVANIFIGYLKDEIQEMRVAYEQINNPNFAHRKDYHYKIIGGKKYLFNNDGKGNKVLT